MQDLTKAPSVSAHPHPAGFPSDLPILIIPKSHVLADSSHNSCAHVYMHMCISHSLSLSPSLFSLSLSLLSLKTCLLVCSYVYATCIQKLFSPYSKCTHEIYRYMQSMAMERHISRNKGANNIHMLSCTCSDTLVSYSTHSPHEYPCTYVCENT